MRLGNQTRNVDRPLQHAIKASDHDVSGTIGAALINLKFKIKDHSGAQKVKGHVESVPVVSSGNRKHVLA